MDITQLILDDHHEQRRLFAMLEQIDPADERVAQLFGEWKRQSWLGRMGRGIEPVVAPLGWDWKIGMAALASFPAIRAS